MKKLLLHIGMPKAGSTSIQHFLKDNEELLAARQIHYLKAGMGREQTKHSKLAQPFASTLIPTATRRKLPKVKLDATAKDLDQALEEIASTDYSVYVISVEELFPTFVDDLTIPDSKVAELYLQWFSKLSEICEITVVVYLRRQDLFVESLYAQFQKGGGSPLRLLTFDEFLSNLKAVGVFDYEQIIQNLTQLPGVNGVIVRPFERSQLVAGDVIADCARFLGIDDISNYVITGESNTKNFPRQFSIMLYQAAIAGTDRQSDKQLRVTFEKMMDSGKKLPEWAQANTGKYFMSPDARAQLVAEYSAGNDNLAAQYLGSARMFHSEPNDAEDPNWTPPVFSTDDLSPELASESVSTDKPAASPPRQAGNPSPSQSIGGVLRRLFGN